MFEVRGFSGAMLGLVLLGCGRSASVAQAPSAADTRDAQPVAATPDAALAQLEPDGNDDAQDPGTGSVPTEAHFERVGRPPLALRRICDLTPFGGALYAAHANEPLGTDGATITRYDPDAARPFTVAFDWNRPGEPTKGGGAGQGFLRVRTIGGRLFVPDSDPPYNGLGLVDRGTEGYVFLSDTSGVFAPPRAPDIDAAGLFYGVGVAADAAASACDVVFRACLRRLGAASGEDS